MAPLTREQIAQQERVTRQTLEKTKYVGTANYNYLDVFEQEQAERRMA